ncbi:hypothetical protein K1T71_001628 [Dendrolimus kikuchii]|uniref:Uncharacterized protein n=1 Tax=Dendrolimus kikuchii TaxID=765133 RepID=A0ACC1DES9_9NEOP|nr:hypothetical protein K1T71_001628 [Dendrolimus kikuchii]
MRWTQELNECVMRAYFEATEGGTNLTSYRGRLLSLFQTLQPASTVTAQRLSDQVRAIQRLHLLDESTLDRLRNTVRINRESTDTPQPTSPAPPADSQWPVNSTMDDVSEGLAVGNVSIQTNEQLRRTLEHSIQEFRDQPILNRPRLPKLPLHRNNLVLMGTLDCLLAPYFRSSADLVDTHSILYCGAVAVCRVAGVKFPNTQPTRPASGKPAWQIRIERRIDRARVLIAKLICFRAGNCRPRVMRFMAQAFAGTNVSPSEYMARATERIDFWKQKVYAWANRIRRYKERADRYFLNRTFQSEEKRVYRGWEKCSDSVTDRQMPNIDAMASFWRNIWSMPVSHTEGDWIELVKQSCEQVPDMEPIIIEPLDVGNAIRSAHNWKSPGLDGLHNFWIKWFKSSHGCLANQFQEAVDRGSLPTFMTTGVTHLLFKSGCTTEPKNYRPITCLPTIYKLLTSILGKKLSNYFYDNNILAITQNGCKAGSRGTKELLLIDTTVSQQARRNKRNLSVAWIDYKKAYDSVPHTWLMRVLELYKVDATLRTFLQACMRQWVTHLRLPGGGGASLPEGAINIERGIFQGDSLSPLWFCLALNPLSTLLESSKLGYRFRRGGEIMSHLLYMDDLKLFASNEPDLIELLKTTERFSKSINMEFGIEKCAVMHVRRGKVVNSPNLQLSENISLKSLSETETYKYLGMSESLGIADADVKQTVKDRFFCRLRKVLTSLLSGGNKVRAFNSWVMPVLAYSFGILRWTQTELDALDRRVRCLLTKYRMHHPRSSVMRLYISRRCGGRGFLNAKDLHNREVNNLRAYFLKMDVGLHKDVVAVDKGLTMLSLAKENWCNLAVLSASDRINVWKNSYEPLPLERAELR